MGEFIYNVGQIVLRENGGFWIFPCNYMNNEKYYISSPWFSCKGEKWRLIKVPYDQFHPAPNEYPKTPWTQFTFRLWRKLCAVPKEDCYTIKLVMQTTDENNLIKCTGIADPDFGCQLKFPRIHRGTCIISQNGLVQLFFYIQRVEETSADTENVENFEDGISKNDESKTEDGTNCEDESNSEDEISSDEENNEKKKVSSEVKGIKMLSKNLKQVLIDERLTDAVLKVENREFKVHKIILVARSPIFASMFEHDMAEKKDNVVDIPDCTAESFEVFLHYLYSGSVETLSANNVYDVYYSADKYHVDGLKRKCVKFMIKNISIETFCDVIALALRHGDTKLQKTATEFFCENIKKIVKSVQWQKYMHENSTQANKLLIEALNA